MEILLIIVALWLMNDAMNGYKAARHAQKVVYNRDLSFIDYMVMNHPIIAGAQMKSSACWMISTVMARAITASSQLWYEN